MKLESLEIAKFKRHGRLLNFVIINLSSLSLSLSLLSFLASLLRFDVVKCDAETVEGHQVNNMFTNEMAGTGGTYMYISSITSSFSSLSLFLLIL